MLVARLQQIHDLANYIQLFLEEDVLTLYMEMNQEDQVDHKMIEVMLKSVY